MTLTISWRTQRTRIRRNRLCHLNLGGRPIVSSRKENGRYVSRQLYAQLKQLSLLFQALARCIWTIEHLQAKIISGLKYRPASHAHCPPRRWQSSVQTVEVLQLNT